MARYLPRDCNCQLKTVLRTPPTPTRTAFDPRLNTGIWLQQALALRDFEALETFLELDNSNYVKDVLFVSVDGRGVVC